MNSRLENALENERRRRLAAEAQVEQLQTKTVPFLTERLGTAEVERDEALARLSSIGGYEGYSNAWAELERRAEAAEQALAEAPISYPVNGGYVLIDQADLDLISTHKWSIQDDGRGRQFALATSRATGKKRSVRMHRLILDAPEGVQVDHANGNTLDNRRSNLRLASAGDNQRNKDEAESESGYKGVHRKERGGWEASICVDNRNQSLGRFSSAAEAALVRDIASLEHHGDFASTNYPVEVVGRVAAAEAEVARLREALARACYLGEHLLQHVTEFTGVIGPGGEREDDYIRDDIGNEFVSLREAESRQAKGGVVRHGDPQPVVPEDRRCPTCHNVLAFDDGLYYCVRDGHMGEVRCPDALKRYRPEEDE